MQCCTSNGTKLIAGATPSGRSSWSSTSDASASPVYFPPPTTAPGSWFSTVPTSWRHIPATFSQLGQLSHLWQDSRSQPLPSRASAATGCSPGAWTTTTFCQVFRHSCLQTGYPVWPLSGGPSDLPVSGSAHPPSHQYPFHRRVQQSQVKQSHRPSKGPSCHTPHPASVAVAPGSKPTQWAPLQHIKELLQPHCWVYWNYTQLPTGTINEKGNSFM